MSRSPYGQGPFGPFPSDHPDSDIERNTSGKVDMRGMSDWKPVFTVETGEMSWGQVVVACEANASPTVAHATELPVFPWVEVRINAYVNNQLLTLLEGAVGSHALVASSPGPIFLSFAPGEVPDRVEVLARARRGGLAETAGDPDEKLELVAVSRFHR